MVQLQTVAEHQVSQGAPLFTDGSHRFIWLGLVEDEDGESVQVNQYVIEHGRHVFLLDPGGVLSFPHVVASLSQYVDVDKVTGLFYSHQDPDVASGIALWMKVTGAQAYISKHWIRFVSHFGHFDRSRLEGIEDPGMRVELGGGDYLQFIPAHFLHSIGQFHVYDSRSKILFTGDVAASVFKPSDERVVQTDRFEDVRPHMEGFHQRYMASQKACAHWVRHLRRYDIEMIAPQHGAILQGRAVQDYLRWLEQLRCGVDIIEDIYGDGGA